MNGHPPWCDRTQCTALPATDLRVQRGGAHRSAPLDLGKYAKIGDTWGPLTAQLEQASVSRPTPVMLSLSTGGPDRISLAISPTSGLGQFLLQALQ